MKQLTYLYWVLAAIIVMYSCANQVAPNGGKKDTTPPKIVGATPNNKSTNFTGKKITIAFDEYVQLDNPFAQVVISPPLEKFPDFILHNKELLITFKETLKENTTYTINFGESIKDNTEGNVLKDFTYVFSTGAYLDSLYIKGLVIDAEKSTTIENVMVMLYKSTDDSVVYKQKPYYFGRTNKNGQFTINNVQTGNYKLFALKDANLNLLYDQTTEPIAFSDTFIEIKQDTSKPKNYRLSLFVEPNKKIRLTEATSKFPNTISYVYNQPITKLTTQSFDSAKGLSGNLFEYNDTKDTITQWLTYSALNPKIKAIANDTIIDTVTILKPQFITDSLKQKNKPTWQSSIGDKKNQGTQHLYKPILLEFNRPINKINTTLIKLYNDSIGKETKNFTLNFVDSIHRKLTIRTTWSEDNWYKLVIDSGAFIDIYNRTNDSTYAVFHTLTPDDYGSINIDLQNLNADNQYITTITDDNGAMIYKENFSGSKNKSLIINHLAIGNYYLKIITDSNKNGRWDSGSYKNKQQPEKVYLHPSPLNVKANWDLKQEIDLGN